MRQHQSKFRPNLTRLEMRLTPATLPTGFVEAQITNAISSATTMEFAPDGKLFVLEQAGTMEVYQGSGNTWTQVAPSNNFFTGNTLTVDSFFERGLLGIAFHPDYMTNRYLYVYYTVPGSPPYNRVSRFTANAAGTQVVAGSEVLVVQLDNLSAGNHNGGAIHFGPDGKLYIAVGENAVPANSQLITNRHGKMLRYNPDGTIPADNPTSIAGIAGTTTGANRAIWAAGLRNPFTFTFHPTTGQMYINDVGQNAWEEVNVGAAGANYGWSQTEGRFTQSSFPNFTNPIIAYRHSTSAGSNYPAGNNYEGFAITGGAFYVSSAYPFPQDYQGDYFFADYSSNWIRRFDSTSNTVINFATGALGTLELKVGSDGCLYYLARDAGGSGVGRVLRINYTGTAAPYIVQHPANRTTSVNFPATFSVIAGGNAPLGYQWRRDNEDIPGATSATYTLSSPTLSDSGAMFSVRVTNGSGNITSNNATLTVTPNQPPVATIATPVAGTHFNYGDTINFSGSATDFEDGALSASALTWRIDYFTGGVQRPFMPSTPGVASGSYAIPTVSPYTLPDVFYRVFLTAQDSNGNITETTRDLLPNTAQVTLQTSPAGLPVQLDGTPLSTPHVFVGVTGQTRSLGAPGGATIGGLAYGFVNWSDGGAIVHNISTPATNKSFTANYAVRPPRVAELRIDDGSGQRSMIRSLRVTFDAIIDYNTVPNNAFQLTGPGGSYGLAIGDIDNSAGRSVVTMTFTGPTIVDGSLPNGDFSFKAVANELFDGLSQFLDGDANGSAGGNYVAAFHRLVGDIDGDRFVGNSDFNLFRTAFGSAGSPTTPGFLSGFDFNNDGSIDVFDFNRFRGMFGSSI